MGAERCIVMEMVTRFPEAARRGDKYSNRSPLMSARESASSSELVLVLEGKAVPKVDVTQLEAPTGGAGCGCTVA